MKRSALFICCCLVSVVVASAQDWRLGLKAGLSIPKLRAGKDEGSFSSGYKSIMGPQTGIVAEYRFSPLLSIQSELNYSAQGGKKEGRQKIRTSIFAAMVPPGITLPDVLYANFNSQVDLSYLEVPLMLRFSFPTSPISRFSFYGGPYVGYLVEATGKSAGRSKIYTDVEQTRELTFSLGGTTVPVGEQDLTMKQDILEQCNRVNYGLQGGIAYTYNVARYEFFVSAGGTYGIKYLQKNADYGQNKTGGASVCIGSTIKF